MNKSKTTDSVLDYLSPSHHRRGIMSTAIRTIIESWAVPRMNCKRISANAFIGNEASLGVFLKCGFKLIKETEKMVATPPSRGGELRGLYIMVWEY